MFASIKWSIEKLANWIFMPYDEDAFMQHPSIIHGANPNEYLAHWTLPVPVQFQTLFGSVDHIVSQVSLDSQGDVHILFVDGRKQIFIATEVF